MTSLPNAHILSIYVLLIVFFYDNTNGFNAEEDRLRYSFLHFLSAALFSAALGDFLISALPNPHLAFSVGAVAFGFCHIFYMFEYFPRIKRILLKLAIPLYLYTLTICYYFLLPKITQHPFVISTLIAYAGVLSTAIIASSSLALETRKMVGNVFVLTKMDEYAGIEPANEIIVLSTYYLSQYAIMESSLVVGFEN
uniref:lysoplasmalogenase n=1 Tax=Meloidogyne javanica TaxID=6303 RepID=A0A915MDG4_MELJA